MCLADFRHHLGGNGTGRTIRDEQIGRVGDFKKLAAWQKSQELVACIYRLTNSFPIQERYGLCSQMRRAAVSVSANVAEGCGRQGDVELRRFVRISLGSLAELECEILLSANLKFVDPESCRRICGEIRLVRRMLQALHQSLASKPH
jgi:four helix bundle protein